jgi:hypothetical protein
VLKASDAKILAGFHFAADVDFGRRIVAHKDNSQAWRAPGARQRFNARLQFRKNLPVDLASV